MGRTDGRSRRVGRWLGLTMAVLVLAGVTAAGAQSLTGFVGGEPAKAADVNANFQLLKTWIEQKLGAVNTPNISVTGTLQTTNTITSTNTISTTGNLVVGTGAATQIANNGRLMVNSSDTTYDVWIQGTTSGSGGDARNLALIGQDEDSGDTLFVNWASEYGGGTQIGGPVLASSNLTYSGNFRGWSVTDEYVRTGSGSTTLLSTTDAVCFLTYMWQDHLGCDPYPMACHVTTSGNDWVLTVTEGGGCSTDVNCAARCINF